MTSKSSDSGITKEAALVIALTHHVGSDYPIDFCEEYPDAWVFARNTAPLHFGGTDMPFMVSKTTGEVFYDYTSFIIRHGKPQHVYKIDAAGVFSEASLDEYWEED